MQDLTRRRRNLFFGQAGIGAAGVLSISFLSHITCWTQADGRAVFAVSAALAVGALAWWALLRLERAKFAGITAPAVDWARELREVRDSRRVIVSAFEIERRRIERDLHDGAQQYLVSAAMKLGEASSLLHDRPDTLGCDAMFMASLLEGAHRDAEEAMRTLRATVSGIHPQVLADLGLLAAVSDMAERSSVDVAVHCPHRLPEMPEEVAAVAWFFCSEAITNIAKHAPEATATLLLAADEDLHVSIVDNGPGGARLRDGGGLVGMRERLAAFGGAMELVSPECGPTALSARIPLLLVPANEKNL
ncbi:sensor histidine kinase [Cryobacterium sp. TmT2-59]|uniref:sensor histidine kinase n=1 Tax=Cryobacterium sp. TmT2-59 TaxID=1259264 RepID=UPI00106A8492|nr:histidine kinase [Cryobacterium sp. TmT2-59]TFC87192.1 sensor histidine kinase [Cryobacterium sp. TmT2-59]